MVLVKMLPISKMRAYYNSKRPRGGRLKRHSGEKRLRGKQRTRNGDKPWAGLPGPSEDHGEQAEDTEEEQAYLPLNIKGLAGRVVKGGLEEMVTRL